MSAPGPPARPPPAGPPRPSGGFPKPSKRTIILIGGLAAAAVIAAAIVAIIASSVQDGRTTTSGSRLEFVKFEVERQEVRVGETTGISFNVQNSEERVIDDARVVIAVEPEVGRNYLSISNSTVELPALNTNARSGDIKVTITATGTPAREAVYVIKGSLYAGDSIADATEFELTIRQPQQ